MSDYKNLVSAIIKGEDYNQEFNTKWSEIIAGKIEALKDSVTSNIMELNDETLKRLAKKGPHAASMKGHLPYAEKIHRIAKKAAEKLDRRAEHINLDYNK